MGLLLIVIPLREPVLSPRLRGKNAPIDRLAILERLYFILKIGFYNAFHPLQAIPCYMFVHFMMVQLRDHGEK